MHFDLERSFDDYPEEFWAASGSVEPSALCWVPGGRFAMGSDLLPEEGPCRTESIDGFYIEEHPVTVLQFARFVAETGYVSTAERHEGDGGRPGALVFQPSREPVALDDPFQWWRHDPAATWRRPFGDGSDVVGLAKHPVVNVSFEDCAAYASWLGRVVPTEAEWECACRSGHRENHLYAWGDELEPGGQVLANYWSGQFPVLGNNKFPPGTSEVGSFPANALGIRDMIGNVWEWTSSAFTVEHFESADCCSTERTNDDLTLKGGSFLCSPTYCARYRPAARIPMGFSERAVHVGFRCAVRFPRAGQ